MRRDFYNPNLDEDEDRKGRCVLTVTYIPGGAPSYIFNSEDFGTNSGSLTISGSGGIYKGAKAFCVETQNWYIINDNLTLTPYVFPISGTFSASPVANQVVSGSVTVLGIPVISGSVSGSLISTGNYIQGTGVAGTPSGGVESIQGVSGGYPISSRGMVVLSSASFTGGSGSTVAYSANDIVSSGSPSQMLTFAGLGRVAGGTGLIHKARITTSASADVSTYGIHLFKYSSASATIAADNSPYQYIYTAGSAGHVGKIVVGPMTTEALGSNAAEAISTIGSTAFPLPYSCASNDTALYGILETASVLTSASPNYNIELLAIQD